MVHAAAAATAPLTASRSCSCQYRIGPAAAGRQSRLARDETPGRWAFTATIRRPPGYGEPGVARPVAYAITTSWARSRALSLVMARLTWVLAVSGLTTS